jgi:hypothetical protein
VLCIAFFCSLCVCLFVMCLLCVFYFAILSLTHVACGLFFSLTLLILPFDFCLFLLRNNVHSWFRQVFRIVIDNDRLYKRITNLQTRPIESNCNHESQQQTQKTTTNTTTTTTTTRCLDLLTTTQALEAMRQQHAQTQQHVQQLLGQLQLRVCGMMIDDR